MEDLHSSPTSDRVRTVYMVALTFTARIGGFLFGYDTGESFGYLPNAIIIRPMKRLVQATIGCRSEFQSALSCVISLCELVPSLAFAEYYFWVRSAI